MNPSPRYHICKCFIFTVGTFLNGRARLISETMDVVRIDASLRFCANGNYADLLAALRASSSISKGAVLAVAMDAFADRKDRAMFPENHELYVANTLKIPYMTRGKITQKQNAKDKLAMIMCDTVALSQGISSKSRSPTRSWRCRILMWRTSSMGSTITRS